MMHHLIKHRVVPRTKHTKGLGHGTTEVYQQGSKTGRSIFMVVVMLCIIYFFHFEGAPIYIYDVENQQHLQIASHRMLMIEHSRKLEIRENSKPQDAHDRAYRK